MATDSSHRIIMEKTVLPLFVLPAKHGRHIGIMSASTSSHYWFPFDNLKILNVVMLFIKGALAIRRIFSLVDMITKPKFSNCPNIFKIGLFR